jgi:two-component system chemotaxis response regulator CheB
MSCGLIVIGVSMGGLHALEVLVRGLPGDFCAPIAIVQHRATDAGNLLAVILRQYSLLPIIEPQDKEVIQPGRIYLAPPDYHLLIDGGAFALSMAAPVSYARPSIDVLFEAAADAYGTKTVGVILTGANHDGAHGATRIKDCGGVLIVQTPETADCAVMPQAAINAAEVDYIVPLPEIAPLLVRLCQG